MMINYPKPGEKYQHYKGGQYEVICMCNHTDTNEPLVVYRSISFGSQYARPLNEWHDEVYIDETKKFKSYLTNRTNRFIKM